MCGSVEYRGVRWKGRRRGRGRGRGRTVLWGWGKSVLYICVGRNCRRGGGKAVLWGGAKSVLYGCVGRIGRRGEGGTVFVLPDRVSSEGGGGGTQPCEQRGKRGSGVCEVRLCH